MTVNLGNCNLKQYRVSPLVLCTEHLKQEYKFLTEVLDLLPKYMADHSSIERRGGEMEAKLVSSGHSLLWSLMVETNRIRVNEFYTRYRSLWEELRKRGEAEFAGNLPNIRGWNSKSSIYFSGGKELIRSNSPVVYLIDIESHSPQVEPIDMIALEIREVTQCSACDELVSKSVRVRILPDKAFFTEDLGMEDEIEELRRRL